MTAPKPTGRRRVRVRPAGFPRPAGSLLLLAVALFLAGRTSGAGWVITILCGLLGAVVVAAVWPAVTLSRSRLVLLDSPRDAVVGSAARFSLDVRRAGPGIRLRATLQDGTGPWMSAAGSCHGEVTVVPARRGVAKHLLLDLHADGPLGLVAWRRRCPIELAAPVEVAPRPAEVTLEEVAAGALPTAEAPAWHGRGDELFRGVRSYVTGDPRRLVHWPATARWDTLMVKETQDPVSSVVVIVVDLRGDPDRSEEAASRAAGLAAAAFRLGLGVDMHTAEEGGPSDGPVHSPLEAGRRLARAVTDRGPAHPGAGGEAGAILVTAR